MFTPDNLMEWPRSICLKIYIIHFCVFLKSKQDKVYGVGIPLGFDQKYRSIIVHSVSIILS